MERQMIIQALTEEIENLSMPKGAKISLQRNIPLLLDQGLLDWEVIEDLEETMIEFNQKGMEDGLIVGGLNTTLERTKRKRLDNLGGFFYSVLKKSYQESQDYFSNPNPEPKARTPKPRYPKMSERPKGKTRKEQIKEAEENLPHWLTKEYEQEQLARYEQQPKEVSAPPKKEEYKNVPEKYRALYDSLKPENKPRWSETAQSIERWEALRTVKNYLFKKRAAGLLYEKSDATNPRP